MREKEEWKVAYEKTAKDLADWADKAVDFFKSTNNFSGLVHLMKKRFDGLDRSGFGNLYFQSVYFSTFITDRLSKSWPQGNEIILRESQRLGIIPHENRSGERLGATDCLSQILELERPLEV